ncbi:hypothetical protein [Pseudonocardia sp.]|nr:hypothetical protein [Pseudonocardia sp.]
MAAVLGPPAGTTSWAPDAIGAEPISMAARADPQRRSSEKAFA